MKRFILFGIVLVLFASGCTSSVNTNDDNETGNVVSVEQAVQAEKLEVYHFHATRQCQGCINVGKCAEDTVNEYFKNEENSGTLVFAHVNMELPENEDLVRQYGPTGSSLWIGVYDKDGDFSKEQNTAVWYKTGDMEKCVEYIKGVIEEKLRGE